MKQLSPIGATVAFWWFFLAFDVVVIALFSDVPAFGAGMVAILAGIFGSMAMNLTEKVN